ncbi:MAG: hypothetical protein ABJN84_18135 [Flavobacteriaceae bacterium]
MAYQMLKPYSLLLYLLALIAFFFVGLTYAGLVGAGKNQGLAGGAIVFGYGIVIAAIGLLVALFLAKRASRKTIIKSNVVLVLCSVAFYAYYHVKFLERQKDRGQENENIEQPKKPITTIPKALAVAEPMTML